MTSLRAARTLLRHELRLTWRESQMVVTFVFVPFVLILLLSPPIAVAFGFAPPRLPPEVNAAGDGTAGPDATTARFAWREATSRADGSERRWVTLANPDYAAFAGVYAFTVPGISVVYAFFIIGIVAQAFLREEFHGTQRRLLAAPVSPAVFVSAKIAAGFAVVVAQFLIAFGLAWALLGLDLGAHAWVLVPITLSVALCATGFGVLVTSWVHTSLQASAAANAFSIVLGAVSGALIPLALLPAWLEPIARATPHYWAVEALRAALLRGAGFLEIAPQLGILTAMGIAAISTGTVRLGRAGAST